MLKSLLLLLESHVLQLLLLLLESHVLQQQLLLLLESHVLQLLLEKRRHFELLQIHSILSTVKLRVVARQSQWRQELGQQQRLGV
jgi:hypothetical protein